MVSLAGVVQNGSSVDIDKVQVDVFVVDENLENLHLLEGFLGLEILHLAETVENGGPVVFI